jgi:hypothetical protein
MLFMNHYLILLSARRFGRPFRCQNHHRPALYLGGAGRCRHDPSQLEKDTKILSNPSSIANFSHLRHSPGIASTCEFLASATQPKPSSTIHLNRTAIIAAHLSESKKTVHCRSLRHHLISYT